MARKKRQFEHNINPAEKEASNMRHLDLQRACLVRGMDFVKMVSSGVPALIDYFVRNYTDKDGTFRHLDNSRLDAFDEWREEIMRKRGKDEPFIRLGFIGQTNKDGEVIAIKRLKRHKKKKKKREKNKEFNIWSGTKKELTYQCAKEGKSLKKTVQKVMAKFPDAKEKSIGIWYKRCLKEQNE